MLKHVYKSTGIEKIADETGAVLNYDLRVRTIFREQSKYIKQLEILKPLTDADIIINLPKLKTHTMMTYTGAIKNMFGAIAGTAKADMHLRMPDYDKFADCLIDIFLSTKPTLNIMDGIDGMEGYGPTNGNPRHLGVLLASTDGFSLDTAALKIIGLPIEKVPVMFNARNRKLLDEEISIIGEPIENVVVDDYVIPALNENERIDKFNRGFMKLIKQWMRPRPEIQNNLCVQCGNCARNCPPGVIIVSKGKKPVIDYKSCIRCFCCHELCAYNAITVRRNMFSRMMLNKSIAGQK
jgi:Pyruvate/2-oxoacid:ferredoxin oxidoreductase delta subunit